MEAEVDAYLRRKYTTAIRDVETVLKEDLDLKNHLSGLKRKLLKVRSRLEAHMALLQKEKKQCTVWQPNACYSHGSRNYCTIC